MEDSVDGWSVGEMKKIYDVARQPGRLVGSQNLNVFTQNKKTKSNSNFKKGTNSITALHTQFR